MQLTFEQPAIWLLLIIPLGGLIGWYVYWHRSKYNDWTRLLLSITSGLRGLAFILIASLLLEPLLIVLTNEVEKPKLLLYQDISQSIDKGADSTLLEFYTSNRDQLDEKYDVKLHQFGERVSNAIDTADDVSFFTDYSKIVESVNDDYFNQNIGAIVVASDGLQTYGQDPRYLEVQSAASLFTVAIGDSSLKPDLEITEILNNKLVFLGNQFEMKVRWKAVREKGVKAQVALRSEERVLASKDVNIIRNNQVGELSFLIDANAVGLNRFTVTIDEQENEENVLNNEAQAFIDVLDNRIKVLIIAKGPDPDVAAIKLAIESNEQYEVQSVILDDWKQDLENVDLAITHGLPTDANDLNKIKGIRDKQIPVLSIMTPKVSLLHFKQLNLGLSIDAKRNVVDQASASINTSFNLFKVPENKELNRFPPMSVKFGEYNLQSEGQVLLYQQIGNIATDKPLLVFTNQSGWKRAMLLGSGWWRWRLFDRMRSKSDWTDRLMVKTVQYLALKQKRTRLNITTKKQVSEGDAVVFEGEYYNISYELDNSAPLELTVTDSADKQFNYRFKNDGKGYKLSVGRMAPGTYNWKAQMQVEGETFNQSGTFVVAKNNAEFMSLQADFNFLEQWSAKHNGSTTYNGDLDKLATELLQTETAKPIIHSSREWTSIIEWKWIAILIVMLMAIEWFLRKLNGYY